MLGGNLGRMLVLQNHLSKQQKDLDIEAHTSGKRTPNAAALFNRSVYQVRVRKLPCSCELKVMLNSPLIPTCKPESLTAG